MPLLYENKGNSLMITRGDNLACGAHLHSHLELIFMLSGTSAAYVDGIKYTIEKDDILLVFPNQIHMYETFGEEDYYIIIFPDTLCHEYQTLFSNRVPESPLVRSGFRNPELRAIVEEIESNTSIHSTYIANKIKGYLLVVLSILFENMRFDPLRKPDTELIKKILLYCSENYAQDIRLETIGHELHVNQCYISFLFRKKLQIGFNDYVNMLRISEACHLLTDPSLNITHISYQSGFNSPRSFNRAFMKHMGMTPREFRTGDHPTPTLYR